VLVEVAVGEFDGMAVEQWCMALRAARPVAEAPGRNADETVTVLADDALLVRHGLIQGS